MNKEELEIYVDETLKFDSIDKAFDDFIYDFTIEELIDFISEEEKERILKISPSYVKHNDKWYFNGNFQDILDNEEINQIIKAKESEEK